MTIPDFARRDPIWCDFTIVYQGFLPQDKTEKLRKLGFYMAKSDWAIQLHFFSTFNGIKFWQNLTATKKGKSNAPRTSKRLTQGLRILQGLGIPIKSRIHALSRHLTHLRIHLTQSRCQILTETKSINGVLITSFHFTSRKKTLIQSFKPRQNRTSNNCILTQRPFDF